MLQNTGKAQLGASAVTASSVLDLRILATSDLHANLLAWDYHANRPCPQRGLARLATLIHAARAEHPQNLLFDNGDFLHGTALGDYIAETTQSSRSGRPLHSHPMIAAMNALRYDAVTLGNHEFGHGLGFLRRSLAAARFPIVSSNLYFKPTRGKPLSAPFLLLDRSFHDRAGKAQKLKIGVLGFLPPQTMTWERRYLKSRAAVDDIVTSARSLLPLLRDAGADIVIALSHSGISAGSMGGRDENASTALAQLSGIDVVIAGHTHLVFPTPQHRDLAGKPAVMPGFFGSHLGVIDLALQKSPQGWLVVRHHAETRPISRRDPATGQAQPLVADDSAIAALAAPAHSALLGRADAEIGHSDLPLNTYFALLTETPALTLVARAQVARLAKGLHGTAYQALPILSAVAPFKAGGRGGPDNYTDIPAGALRARHANDLYIHPNSLVAVQVSGNEVAAWLERSASMFHQILPGAQDVPLIDDQFPSFNFDVIHGLSYRIDLSQPPRFDCYGSEINPAARRIVDLRHNGAPLLPDQVFVLATNSYRAAGGAGFAGADPARLIYEGHESNREVLAHFLRDGGQPQPLPQPAWGFAALPDSAVVFDASPSAADHLAEVPHLHITPLGLNADGFRRFRLRL